MVLLEGGADPDVAEATTARPLHYVAPGHGGRAAAVLAAHGARGWRGPGPQGAVDAAAGGTLQGGAEPAVVVAAPRRAPPAAVRPRGEPEARAQDSQCQSFPKKSQ